jgi:tetratricopeptide (TPR) repeat protein
MYYRGAVAAFVLAALIAAGWWSIRLARADAFFRERTPASVARAVELAPLNTTYLALSALQNEYEGKDSRAQLETMARLNPRASAPRIRLGLAAEVRGDALEAERWLLEAAAVDRQFETRWTLANFYFRQDRDEFWSWIEAALEMSYGDRKPAFDLCWRKSANAGEILDRAIPPRAEVAAAYVWYLIGEKRLDAVAPAALRLAELDPAAVEPLLAAVDAQLDAGRSADAVAVWTATRRAAPAGIWSPRFEQPPVGRGFDWRFAKQEGVTHIALDAPSGHRVRLSGRQPESCELMRQLVGGLRPGAAYQLRWRYRTEAAAGVEWRIAGRSARLEAGQLRFTAPGESALLQLFYQRPSGEVRAEGSVDLLEVVAVPAR